MSKVSHRIHQLKDSYKGLNNLNYLGLTILRFKLPKEDGASHVSFDSGKRTDVFKRKFARPDSLEKLTLLHFKTTIKVYNQKTLYDLICEEILCLLIHLKTTTESKLTVKNVPCSFFSEKKLALLHLKTTKKSLRPKNVLCSIVFMWQLYQHKSTTLFFSRLRNFTWRQTRTQNTPSSLETFR